MAEVSYFQRYSQRENHVTNNTLLILKHFYQQSPRHLEAVLSALLDDGELAIGPRFEQQVAMADSAPDALISQRPLNLYVETKLSGDFDREQLERHMKSIAKKTAERHQANNVLIAMGSQAISGALEDDLSRQAESAGIRFAAATFFDLVESLRGCCGPHNPQLREIVDDYEDFLNENELLAGFMSIVPTVGLIDVFSKYRLYRYLEAFPSRATDTGLFGLYAEGRVRYICRLNCVAIGTCGDDGFKHERNERGEATDEELARIGEAVKHPRFLWDGGWLDKPLRVYLFDDIHETDFRGRIRTWRRLDLNGRPELKQFNGRYDAGSVAECLKGASF